MRPKILIPGMSVLNMSKKSQLISFSLSFNHGFNKCSYPHLKSLLSDSVHAECCPYVKEGSNPAQTIATWFSTITTTDTLGFG